MLGVESGTTVEDVDRAACESALTLVLHACTPLWRLRS